LSVAIRDTEHGNVQGIYYYLGVSPLTFQQEQFVLLVFRGLSITAAARSVGMSFTKAKELWEREETQKIAAHLREQVYYDTRVTLEALNSMAFEAHRKSMTATEELKAVDTLAKLNMVGGYAPKQIIDRRLAELDGRGPAHAKDVTPPNSMNQLERMKEEDLLRLAKLEEMGELNPEPVKRNVIPEELVDGAPWPEGMADVDAFEEIVDVDEIDEAGDDDEC
jgi:phage terminase small subunit